jgi:hypothetical protein
MSAEQEYFVEIGFPERQRKEKQKRDLTRKRKALTSATFKFSPMLL